MYIEYVIDNSDISDTIWMSHILLGQVNISDMWLSCMMHYIYWMWQWEMQYIQHEYRKHHWATSLPWQQLICHHYGDVIMATIASQITSLTIVYWTVYSGVDQRKHQSSVSLAFVWGIHRGPMNSPHKWPVTRKMFPFDDVIMIVLRIWLTCLKQLEF